MCHVVIYSGTQEFIRHKGCNKMYISDAQLHAMELFIHPAIQVQVESLAVERISQMSRWTGSQGLRGGDRWNDWVWVKHCPGRCYGPLNGSLPWQLQWLFEIELLNENGTFVEYWLALLLTTLPENLGNLDPVSKFVQVRTAPAAIALQGFSVGNMVGCTHVIAETATSTRSGDRGTRDGLSVATSIWRLGLMCKIGKQRIAFYAQVEERWGEIFAASPIALLSRCKRIPNEPILTCGLIRPQCQSVRLK